MSMSKVCPVLLGTLAVLVVAMGLPAVASAAPTLDIIKPAAGNYTMPTDFVSALPGPGTTQTIGFDNLTNGVSVKDQYLLTDGVEFGLVGSTSGTGKLIANGPNSTNGGLMWGNDSISPSNTLASWNTVLSGGATVVRISFIPQGNQMLPRAAGFVFADSPYDDVMNITAFDKDGNPISTKIFSNCADRYADKRNLNEARFLGFQYYDTADPTQGISALEYTMQVNEAGDPGYETIVGNEIDNLTYEMRFGSTPEPATLALMGMGTLMMIGRRIRRRAGR